MSELQLREDCMMQCETARTWYEQHEANAQLLIDGRARLEQHAASLEEHAMTMTGLLGYELDSQVAGGYMTREAADTMMAEVDSADPGAKANRAKELLEEAGAHWGLERALRIADLSDEGEAGMTLARVLGDITDEFESERQKDKASSEELINSANAALGSAGEDYDLEALARDQKFVDDVENNLEFLASRVAICATCTGPGVNGCPVQSKLEQ